MATNECGCERGRKEGAGFWAGVLYGLLPHSFCIAFVVFSVIGATVAVGVVRQLLLIPYLFHFLVGLSLAFATLSAAMYLRKMGFLSWEGIKRKWRYLSVMYGMTVSVNLLLFMVVFPMVANLGPLGNQAAAASPAASPPVAESSVTLLVNIPCAGHAPLIIEELKKLPGVQSVAYKAPRRFEVRYDPARISLGQIMALEVFETYKAIVRSP